MHMVYLISVSPIQNLAERKGTHCSSFQDNVTQLKYTSQLFSSLVILKIKDLWKQYSYIGIIWPWQWRICKKKRVTFLQCPTDIKKYNWTEIWFRQTSGPSGSNVHSRHINLWHRIWHSKSYFLNVSDVLEYKLMRYLCSLKSQLYLDMVHRYYINTNYMLRPCIWPSSG
jgi:hypothetical protein